MNWRNTCCSMIIFSALATSLTLFVDASSHVEIVNQPLDKKVEENRRLKLSCRVLHLSNNFVVKWYKDGHIISSGWNITGMHIDKERFFLTGDAANGQYNLRIQNVQRYDAGIYACRVYRTLGQSLQMLAAESGTAEVQVVYLPNSLKYPDCSPTSSESGITENSIVPLCFAKVGVPPIRLELVDDYGNVYRDGVYLDYSRQPSYVYLLGNITRNDDGATFWCRARSSYFKLYEVKCLLGPIKVIKKPKVHLEELQSTINVGDDVRYICHAESDSPIIEYKWYILPTIQSSKVSYFDNRRGIRLSSVSQIDDNKLVSCTVRTKAGITSATSTLKISGSKQLKSTTIGIIHLPITGSIQSVNIGQQQSTVSPKTVLRTMLSVTKPLSAAPPLKSSDESSVFLALSALIIFQFMVILVACVFFCKRTKKEQKLPNETEFQVAT